jgi:uncharacterized protein YbdZ (MbtH family)
MPDEQDDDPMRYVVVMNDEEQYSIWPEGRDLPLGWATDGFSGLKQACLEHINEVWQDMRPLSLRRWMENPPDPEPMPALFDDTEPTLVERLTAGPQRITWTNRGGQDSIAAALGRGLILLVCPDTRGPAELAVAVPPTPTPDPARFTGYLTLDWEDLSLTGQLDPATGEGTAVLSRVRETGTAGA